MAERFASPGSLPLVAPPPVACEPPLLVSKLGAGVLGFVCCPVGRLWVFDASRGDDDGGDEGDGAAVVEPGAAPPPSSLTPVPL
nr:hypothetical protein [Streptomyces sp. NBC_01255]